MPNLKKLASNRNKTLKFIFGFLFITTMVVLVAVFWRPQAQNEIKVYFLDVGQGDSEYIKNPDGEDILIDGGPDNSVLNDLDQVMNFGDREINLVILTHPHADHITGLIEVLNRYQVDEVWETGVEYPSSSYDEWKNKIREKNIPDKSVSAGEIKNFGSTKIEILYPLSPLQNNKIDNVNNASIVSRLDYGNFSVLFTGDAEKEVQQQLVDKNIYVDVLKVAHHGSENGLLEDFLTVTRPAVAVISVGAKNTYGHPAQSTINLLKKYAIRIFRTDQNGTIEIDSDGKDYEVKTSH